MTQTKQYRNGANIEIRAVDEGSRQFTARVVNYNVVDSYGTVWLPGCFTESLQRKLPKVVWAHDWTKPIGKVISFDDTPEHLDVTVQLDDFEDVPLARQCFSQLKSGSMDEFSFGFVREEWTYVENAPDLPGAIETMTKARMDEVSPVLVGAVPNTQLLSTRSAERVARSDAASLLTRVAAGAMPLSEALRVLESPVSAETGSVTEGQPTEESKVDDLTALISSLTPEQIAAFSAVLSKQNSSEDGAQGADDAEQGEPAGEGETSTEAEVDPVDDLDIDAALLLTNK